jgi:mono/diheme cytochrome c family protein
MRRLSMNRIWLTIALAPAALTLTLPAGAVRAQGKSAADLYLDKCSVCHGADGAAKTAKGKKLKVKDVRETAPKLSAEEMIDIVTKGKSPDMDGFAKVFSADQIKEIVAHYRSLAKK